MATRELDVFLATTAKRVHFVGPLQDLYVGLPPWTWPAVSRAYARGRMDAAVENQSSVDRKQQTVESREADVSLPFEALA